MGSIHAAPGVEVVVTNLFSFFRGLLGPPICSITRMYHSECTRDSGNFRALRERYTHSIKYVVLTTT